MSRALTLVASIAQARSTLSRFASVYAGARAERAALAPYPTAADVAAALEPASRLDVEGRNALVVALVTELQARPHPLWQALLLGAFEPMLTRARMRLGRRRDPELDQRVLVAFLGALRSVRTGPFTLLAIRWATCGEVFDARRKEARGPELTTYDDETHPADVFGTSADDQARLAEVARIVEAEAGAELLDVLIATHGHDESLKDYVARAFAGRSERERATTYYQLRVARSALVERVRQRLSPRSAATAA
jgi:hypothetical protein